MVFDILNNNNFDEVEGNKVSNYNDDYFNNFINKNDPLYN